MFCRSVLILLTLCLGVVHADDLPFKLQGSGGKVRGFTDLAEVTVSLSPTQGKPGDKILMKFTISPKNGGYTYPFNPTTMQASVNRLSLDEKGPLEALGAITDPLGWSEKEGTSPGEVLQYYSNATTWEIPLQVKANAVAGKVEMGFPGSLLQACNDNGCFPFSKLPKVSFEVLAGGSPATTVAKVEPPKTTPPVEPKVAPTKSEGHTTKVGLSTTEYAAQLKTLSDSITAVPVALQGGVAGLLLAAAFWGFISLFTPCVFPMIPITVSLFLKQADQSAGRVLRLAAIYCITIVLVLGLSAFFALQLFRELSINPYMNIALAGLFVVFALSLLGMFDLTLPNFLLQGAESRRKLGGTIGTVFGAVAFSIVSFTCVAPFLGGFAGLVSSGNYSTLELILAALAFSSAFALPFFVLALFPRLIKKLPKSGGWLDTVKALMGFLELAAAFKFLRNAELRLLDTPKYFTYEVTLVAWIAISIVAGLYLLRQFRLPHDEEPGPIPVPQVLLGITFLGLGVYLTPALFPPTKPTGEIYAWVNAFLLPDPGQRAKGFEWSADLKAEVDEVIKQRKSGVTPEKPYIFIDFTGVTCTNCTINENNIFPLPEVQDHLKKYRLVKLYTDDVPAQYYSSPVPIQQRTAEAALNMEFQQSRFSTEQLPLYVLLAPQADGRIEVLGVYDEGKINNTSAFIDFLKKPFGK
ncbi:MAG: protein-disulfide reductase DsbD family protein [Fimbriiglobus sp.]